MKKRLLTLTLALAIVTGLLAGCTGGKTTSGTPDNSKGTASGGNNSASESTVETYTPPELNLDGYEFKIAEAWSYGEADRPVLEPGVSNLNDAIIERNKKIEETFGCTISYEYYDPFSFFDLVTTSLLAGDKIADAMTPVVFNFGKFVNANQLYDLKDLPGINLDKPWWNQKIRELTTFGDGIYGASAQFSRVEGEAIGLFYNRRILSDMGMEDPQKLVQEGKWDLDAFKSYVAKAPKDLNNDGVFDDNDQWAVTGECTEAMNALFVGGGNHILQQIDGKVQYVLGESSNIDYLLKMKDVFAPEGSYYNPNWDFGKQLTNFVSGKVFFFVGALLHYPDMRDMADDFGVLPIPAAPGSNTYHSLITHNSPIVCVPTTIDNPEATGAILEAMAAYSQPEFDIWMDDYATLTLRDDESVRIARDIVIPSLTLELAFTGHFISPELTSATTNMVSFPVLIDRTQEPASSIDAVKEQAQAMVDEIYNNH